MKKFIVVFKKDVTGSLHDTAVSDIQARGAIVSDRLPIINGVVAEMSGSVAENLKQLETVDYVEEDSEVTTC